MIALLLAYLFACSLVLWFFRDQLGIGNWHRNGHGSGSGAWNHMSNEDIKSRQKVFFFFQTGISVGRMDADKGADFIPAGKQEA
jgi:hypothetical protein